MATHYCTASPSQPAPWEDRALFHLDTCLAAIEPKAPGPCTSPFTTETVITAQTLLQACWLPGASHVGHGCGSFSGLRTLHSRRPSQTASAYPPPAGCGFHFRLTWLLRLPNS